MRLYAFTCGSVTAPLRGEEHGEIQVPVPSYLIEHEQGLVLVDTGLHPGVRDDPRRRVGWVADLMQLELPENEDIGSRLRSVGVDPGSLRYLVNTHLHFDHAGGNTYRDASGQTRLSFPRARYLVQRGEWEYAHWANERTQASYLRDNFDPVHAAGVLDLVDGDVEVVPGISTLRTPGHVPHHQSVVVRSGGETACFVADVMPTMAHLPLPWIMGYDVEPLVTLESKRALLRRAEEERWLLVSTHDPVIPWGYAVRGERGLTLEEVEG